MKIFSDFDVYEHNYTYDEMKVMSVLSTMNEVDGFDYEDLCCIAEAVYVHWANPDEIEEEKIKLFPWIEIKGDDEYGYIQAYAHRVLPEFIKLYKEKYWN